MVRGPVGRRAPGLRPHPQQCVSLCVFMCACVFWLVLALFSNTRFLNLNTHTHDCHTHTRARTTTQTVMLHPVDYGMGSDLVPKVCVLLLLLFLALWVSRVLCVRRMGASARAPYTLLSHPTPLHLSLLLLPNTHRHTARPW